MLREKNFGTIFEKKFKIKIVKSAHFLNTVVMSIFRVGYYFINYIITFNFEDFQKCCLFFYQMFYAVKVLEAI
jgi:hypothetical protein